MRIARHGVDLAIGGLELVVKRGQVLQLRRAHEREVRRVEEEHAPVAQHVVLRDGGELVLAERLEMCIRDRFFVEMMGAEYRG